MNNHNQWITRQVRLGRILLALGALLAIAGIILPRLAGELGFNTRVITGLGILLLGIGTSYLVRYGAALRDPKTARQMTAERDERMQFIRAKAGNRAFWVETALAYALLMWVSQASNGSLPALNDDALWFALAAVVIVPFAVYAGSLAYDQSHS